MDACTIKIPSIAPSPPDDTILARSGAQQRGLKIIVRDLRYTVDSNTKKGEKVALLKGVTACFEPGEMAAVMGASGSGKTTMLDLLAGRKTTGEAQGIVLFGTTRPSIAFLRRHTGYVEQFDTLVDTLTVREMLLYTAELKRSMDEPFDSKVSAVEDLILKLGLTRCRDVRIGSPLKRGISGGQAKRTNVGIALITNPAVLFLDEPTSGLDSYTANEVMAVVKSIAKDGVTICATIHSPSSYTFALFDRCLVLAGGCTAYFGNPQAGAISFFTESCGARQPTVGDNLAEWMMDIITQSERSDSSAQICDAYAKSELSTRNQASIETAISACVLPPTPVGRESKKAKDTSALIRAESGIAGLARGQASFLGQYATSPLWSLRVLLKYRTLRNYMNVEYMAARLADKVIFACLIMLLFFGLGDKFSPRNIPNMCALIYLCIAQPAWGAVTYLPAIVLERSLYVREHNDGLYRPIVYLLFKMIDELFVSWLGSLISCSIIFFSVQLQGSFLYFWLNLSCTLSNGVVIAYFLASACPTLDVANSAVPTLLAMMLFLSGFLIRVPDIPIYVRWITPINMLTYSFAGLMLNQFEDRPETEIGGSRILEFYGVDKYDKWQVLGVVSAFFVFWSFCAWVALAFIRHHRR